MRTEHDTLGSLELPEECPYGIHTARALLNFGDIGERHDPVFVRPTPREEGGGPDERRARFSGQGQASAIAGPIDDMLDGEDFEDIVVNPLSGGAGTSLNMNVNEVIANRALVRTGRARGDYAFVHPWTT
jgi:aspartate ammonia-lyase